MVLRRFATFALIGVLGLPSTIESRGMQTAVCNDTSSSFEFRVEDLASTFDLTTCLTNNFGTIASFLGNSCSALDLLGLINNQEVMTLFRLVTSIIANPTNISPLVYHYMANQTVRSVDNLCNSFNRTIIPCSETVIPKLFPAILSDEVCCPQLSDLIEMLNVLVPSDHSIESYVVNDLINGFNRFFCSQKGAMKCGLDVFSQLTSKYTAETFNFIEHVIFPFITIGGNDKCAALSGNPYTDTASQAPATTINYGCCVHQMRPLIQSFQASFKHVTSDNFWDFANGIVKFTAPKASFVDTLSGTESCVFGGNQCTNPKRMAANITMSPKSRTVKSGMNDLVDTKCTMVKKCNGDNTVCSQVCKRGSVVVPDWLQSTLTYQRRLASRKPFCFTHIPSTHNSAITLAEGFGNRDQLFNKNLSPNKPWSYLKTNDQVLSMTDQLNLGIRSIEVDAHFFLNDFHTAHCGNFDFKPLTEIAAELGKTVSKYGDYVWGPELVGCFPSISGIKASEQPLSRNSLGEVKTWLDANPNDFVIMYVDTRDDFERMNLYGAYDALLTKVFGKLLVPRKVLDDLALNQWKGGSIHDFQKAGYQILVVMNLQTNVAFDLNKLCTVEQVLNIDYIDDVPDKNRQINGIPIYNGSNWVRSWSEQLRYVSLSARGQFTRKIPLFFDTKTIPKYLRWNLNSFALDNTDTAKVTAMVWSWAEGEPSTTDSNAFVFMNSNGRWVASTTAIRQFRACWSDSRLAWRIVSYAVRCPAGTHFSSPTDPYQNYLLHELLVTRRITNTSVVINAELSIDATEQNTDSSAVIDANIPIPTTV